MKIKLLFLFLSLLLPVIIFAQEKFDEKILNNSRKYGSQVEKAFTIIQTSNFAIDTIRKVNLKCGLRSSNYVNSKVWAAVKDDVEVVSVSIVFSKYPIRKNGYRMNHKLLFSRLQNLFVIDPLLNDVLIDWKIILHTNCKNDAQVDSLFHGIIIEYKKDDASSASFEVPESMPISNSGVDLLKKIELFNDLPNNVRQELKSCDSSMKTELLINYFEKILNDTNEVEITEDLLDKHEKTIYKFINTYGDESDNVVYKVFNRNRQWRDALIVADWTGSMYQYGAQALLWHTLNFENSGLDYFALFNDGDQKSSKDKIIGETGGVYFEETNNIDKIVALYQLVMLKGYGGDGPENDIEAILKGIAKYPSNSQIILIADNNACVRDIALLKDVKKPIRVIICGYDKKSGINPQYIKIAMETGGSLHTIEDDIYNLKYETNNKGKVKSLLNSDMKLGPSYCYCMRPLFPDSYYDQKLYTDLDSALKDKARVINLDLSNISLKRVPRKIRKFRSMKSIDLSGNKLRRINNSVIRARNLVTIDLSDNIITKFPYKFGDIHGLQRLDLSSNNIDTIKPLKGFKNLVHLNLSNNNIRHLPNRLRFNRIQFLYLNNNRLHELPASIGRLRKLKELYLSGNSISVLGKRICYLRKLEVLDLSDNDLSILPRRIIRLRKLKMLRLSGNNFSSEYIAYLKKILPKTTIEYQ